MVGTGRDDSSRPAMGNDADANPWIGYRHLTHCHALIVRRRSDHPWAGPTLLVVVLTLVMIAAITTEIFELNRAVSTVGYSVSRFRIVSVTEVLAYPTTRQTLGKRPSERFTIQNPRWSSIVQRSPAGRPSADLTGAINGDVLDTHGDRASIHRSPRSEPRRQIQFMAPLLHYGYLPAVEAYLEDRLSDQPLLLYLPGFDGTFLSPFVQFPELHTVADVRCLTVSPQDRSTLDELVEDVIQYLSRESDPWSSTTPTNSAPLNATNPPLVSNPNTTTPADSFISNNRTDEISSPSSNQPEKPKGQPFWASWFGFPRKSANTTQTTPPPAASNSKRRSPSSSPSPMKRRLVYLAGESFGGILASQVALKIQQEESQRAASSKSSTLDNRTHSTVLPFELKGLILINSATCYDRSKLAAEGPAVAQLHSWLYPFGLLTKLLPLFADDYSTRQLWLILQGKALPSVIDNACREAYMGRVAFSLPFLPLYMPQATLQWRLTHWLAPGCAQLLTPPWSSRLAQLPNMVRILIVAAEHDRALPSIAEAERLASLWSKASDRTAVHVVKGAGHASTCGSRIDLAALMRQHFPELRNAPPVPIPLSVSSTVGVQQQQQPQQQQQRQRDETISTSGAGFLRPLFWRPLATKNLDTPRTAMKDVASSGEKEYFGMEPRYDNQTVGLNPLFYWSKKYYRRLEQSRVEVVSSETDLLQ